ncbi:transcriptional regulator, AraC family [Hydrobacter penzbergensis]|uniref:Transcriptional regulator, AraC family n=1 Tax=Hydrobacter penzbergensis TaxID=1235997 RepID=A0A8X8LDJ3_9BACT|nr:AraC family transcriptional regulator [Hydrobacter penzbergensis]SDW51998.1 transcriptional regulator, AraC family [Hydrobacter penzbergensis]
MKFIVKNMVCNRCIMVVKQVLEEMNLQPLRVAMGEIELKKPVTAKQLDLLNEKLKALGFEVLDNTKQSQIEKIKSLLIQKVQQGDLEEHFSITDFITQSIHKEYSQLSRLFSEVEGLTVEQFFILQKIEKVKEWLIYNESNLSEIAWKLGYSSVAHLSAQFKKITGLTPSAFKKIGGTRKSLDEV